MTKKKMKKTVFKLLSAYYMDTFSGNGKNSLDLLISKISIKFLIPTAEVEEIFNKCDSIDYPQVSSDDILQKYIPFWMRSRLVDIAGENEFIELGIRYYPMLLTDGLFLSIDPRLLKALESSSKLPNIETYASPFNHTLTNYCSLFVEDMVYGSLPRFDEFVNFIDYPARLLVNPPYTTNAIRVCVDKLLSYMSKQRGEFIAIMPMMYDFEPLDRLLQYPNTKHAVLEANNYTLYSFMTEKTILATMKLQVFVNIAENGDEMIDTIVSKMNEYANELKHHKYLRPYTVFESSPPK
jgi:hypothetical protein